MRGIKEIIMKIIKKFLVWLRIIIKSFHGIFCLNIGDYVKYNGEIYELRQGTCRPKWEMQNIISNVRISCYEKDFNKLITLRNILHGFKFTYRFYMGYWFDIMVMKFPNSAWDRRSKELGF